MKEQIGEPARSGRIFIRLRVDAQVVFSIIGVDSQTANIIIPKIRKKATIFPPVSIFTLGASNPYVK